MFRKLFINHTESNFLLLFRYGFVSMAAFVFDFGGLIALTEVVGLNYLVAATISFCVGVIVNFTLSTGWIFKDSKLTKLHHEFAAVFAIALVGLALNDLTLWLLTSKEGVFYVYSKLCATVLTFFWNFFVRKKLLHES